MVSKDERRTVRSHAEDVAMLFPSGATATPEIGAVWPDNVRSRLRCAKPPECNPRVLACGHQPAIRRDRDCVHCAVVMTQDLDRRITTRNCRQWPSYRKTPVTASTPSDDVASARTGPPWPRGAAHPAPAQITAGVVKTMNDVVRAHRVRIALNYRESSRRTRRASTERDPAL